MGTCTSGVALTRHVHVQATCIKSSGYVFVAGEIYCLSVQVGNYTRVYTSPKPRTTSPSARREKLMYKALRFLS
jgi:hypothetical protein